MSKFKVGEIAIYIDDEDGGEVEILRVLNGFNEIPLKYRTGKTCVSDGTWYELEHSFTMEKYLRKKHPPQQLSTWDAEDFKVVGWRPDKQEVEV